MCKYAMVAYKPHYACFECKKTFKRKLLVDFDRDTAYTKGHKEQVSKCPQCSGLMANMGLDFESPKKNDIKAWKHIKNLFESGITYHSCGCSGPGYIPKDKEKLITFLTNRKNDFVKHRRFWSSRIAPQNKGEKEREWSKNYCFLAQIPNNLIKGTRKTKKIDSPLAIEYWTKKIDEIEMRISNLIAK